ncbi:MAG TPA: AAA family ATPase [Xanthobacteraceae bacterium]|nr:AAA family ATPase [Xanthobacteraceae bacterium]
MTDAWSPQQLAALARVEEWFAAENAPQTFRLFGYAGTGKTTLAIEIAKRVRAIVKERKGEHVTKPVIFAAFTGKAALVMRSKGCIGASTIHSLIYRVDEDGPTGEAPKFVLKEDSDLTDAALCIIDECSMVGAELANDLLSFGVKVLVLGDPAQLPPVQDAGYFTNAEPDAMLTEVHRQAEGNPIIRLSMDVREGRQLEPGDHGACRILRRGADQAIVRALILEAEQVLVGKNDTRVSYNNRIRDLLGFRGDPKAGERLVCLRNDHTKGIFNGGLFRVEKVRKANAAMVRMVVKPDDSESDRRIEVKVHPHFFVGRENELPWQDLKKTQRMTYGYALTVHKSQGSQWNNVVLFDESAVFRDDARRWLYTGITRAAERLTVVM